MPRTVNLDLPQSWQELSQLQLEYLLKTMASVHSSAVAAAGFSLDFERNAAQVQTLFLFHCNALEIDSPYLDGWMLRKSGSEPFFVSAEQLLPAVAMLDWSRLPPDYPVCLETAAGTSGVDTALDDDFSFESWLAAENIWQGFLHTQDDSLLRQLAALLYPDPKRGFNDFELLGVFFWWAGLKTYFSVRFPSFFVRSSSDSQQGPPDRLALQNSVDVQIRALTKGDITKEPEVLSMPAIRALTELNALAREYSESKIASK